jgi:hypothetical protein
LGLGLLVATAPPALATDGDRAPTKEEQRAAERKLREAERYLASASAQQAGLSALAICPTSTTTSAPTAASATPLAGSGATTQSCPSVPQGFLAVEARDQINGIYCGPAVGQVISNYAWAMGSGLNKYTQNQLATWMRTNQNGGTGSWWLASGLQTATNGSPRQPGGWQWVVQALQDGNRNGTTGDELHGFVRANISGSRMPLAVSVKPHSRTSGFRLTSWPNPVDSVGHWIAVYGWWDLFDGDDGARTYYTDSSRDEGGSTGKFWDPTRHIAIMIGEHTKQFVW